MTCCALSNHPLVNETGEPRWRYKKSDEEMAGALNRQIVHLRTSSVSFDAGNLAEAERLAAVIYILCHDGGKNSRSLLAQIGIRDTMKFPDTGSWPPLENGAIHADPPLVALNMGEDGTLSYVAPFGDASRMNKLAFSRWWEQKIYTSRSNTLNLSRKNLVFSMRTQDGGAHVDDTLKSEAYYRFSRIGDHETWNKEMTFSVFSAKNGDIPLQNGHLFTMRQMAWELDQALHAAGY